MSDINSESLYLLF